MEETPSVHTFSAPSNSSDGGAMDYMGPQAAQSQTVNGGAKPLTPELEEAIKHQFIGRTHKSMEEAEEFYEGYALWRGFAIKKSKNNRTASGEITLRVWSCTRAGKRWIPTDAKLLCQNKPSKSKRCDCKAFMKAHRDSETGCWKITSFSDTHNHPLIPFPLLRFVSQYREVTAEHIEETLRLRSAGIGVSHIYLYFAALAQGFENVGFEMRDLYNSLALHGQGFRKGGDSDAAIDYMIGQQLKDPSFFYTFERDDEKSLKHLLWIDGESRRDYACFGDVLIVDATYNTNAYGMPLVILAGVSNHHITVPFAFALVHDENTSTYEWIFNQFKLNMSNRAPLSVVTDGDRAMARAITSVFGEQVHHRLCGWHILQNAKKHVHSKVFINVITNCIFGDLRIDQFDSEWERMENSPDLSEKAKSWLTDAGSTRHMWANAYLRGSFFGQVRTTQRVEGLNSRVKSNVRGSMRIYELVAYLDMMVQKARNLQQAAEFDCIARMKSAPLVHRWLHEHASSVYTPKSMETVGEQLQLSGGLIVQSRITEEGQYVIKEAESGVEWTVQHTRDTGDFFCECQFLQTVGFPCRHIFMVMTQERVFQLPDSLIRKRWTKSARDIQHGTAPVGEKPTSQECRYLEMLESHKKAYWEARDDAETAQLIVKGIDNVIADAKKRRLKATSYTHARNPTKATKCMKNKKQKTRGKSTFARYPKGGKINTKSGLADPSQTATDVHETPTTSQPASDGHETSIPSQPASDVHPTEPQLPNNYWDWDMMTTLWGDTGQL